jgi:DNA-binding NtrC family response regulator
VTLKEAMDSAMRGYLYRLISETRGNGAKAAKIAGVGKPSFYRILRRYGIVTGRMRKTKSAFEEQGFQTFHGASRSSTNGT